MISPTRPYAGVVPPVLTPLTADGEVDVPSLERLVAHLLDAGCHGLFPLGSSGETVYLTDAQRDLALEVVVKTTAGAVPVIAGCIEPTTARVLGRTRAAEFLGADAVVVTAPFYTLVGPHEVERHFRAVAERTALDVLAYDIPACVHTKLPVELQLRLAVDGVLAGVKDSSGDDVAFRQLLVAVAEQGLEYAALTGHEVVVDGMLLAGADGSVPGLGNVDPAGYVRLHAAAAAGDWTTARAEQDRLVQLFRVVDAADPRTTHGSTRGVGGFKTALALLGVIETNTVSLPMRSLDAEETARVRAVLESTGLL
ncbi:dihydrodipicolinate synthase family protein [Nocardioides deserti]|uniref:dihydrodipicolinate synthase family protein n=1 Tax=Nocardioides deserti TaxID=1588644 RepID=UPI0019A28BBF|nr:dihydrodipicolinate synthase family protein [Nocardioides deserti]GGO68099.1 dihydrodipicolinate synthase family protein [Nocardioides deserti]